METVNFSFRTANSKDVHRIAAIHTQSWQLHYRGILSDHYLDYIAPEERLEVWEKRFGQKNEQRGIILVEEKETTCGFACNFLDHDARWGTLLDNLHVLKAWQGRGLGKLLLQKSIDWSKSLRPDASLYLWVYKENLAALNFYKHNGGQQIEEQIVENPDGGKAAVFRIVWA